MQHRRAEAPAPEVGELRREIEEARDAARAYRRAIRRYEQLMRHRIANPVCAIAGLAQTLCTVDGIADDQGREMLRVIRSQAEILLAVTTEPRACCAVEATLEPWPSPARIDRLGAGA